MNIFNPSHLSWRHSGGITHYPIADFSFNPDGCFTYNKNGITFSTTLYESLKNCIHFAESSLYFAYANHWSMWPVRIKIGNIARTSLGLPHSYKPFAFRLPTAVQGENGAHCFPSLFGFHDGVMLISTTAHQSEHIDSLGLEMDLYVDVWAYNSENAPGWKQMLYESLTDFSDRKWNLSVFKLATALEMCADAIFEVFLGTCRVPCQLNEQLVQSARNWDQKAKRLVTLWPILMHDVKPNPLSKGALKSFEEKVRKPRNEFAHSLPSIVSMERAHDAHKAAFEILWGFYQIENAISTRTARTRQT